ncbi:MAG: hypothetical protein LBQ09_07330 [Acidobacteriaceae bacterium]|jgi:hypothetical protein|nr:hypothetical protein [Acidobacteriaceae bacterium]
MSEASAAADSYSPHLRTALLLTGIGTDGAYHAGVLRALHDAGVKIDVASGRGVGAVGAMFTAIDAGARLWDERGFWRVPATRQFYPFRPAIRGAARAVALAIAIVAVPLAVMAAGLVVFPIDFLLKMVGLGGASGLTGWYLGLAQTAFAPEGLPTWVPRLVVLVLGAAGLAVAVTGARIRSPRAQQGAWWWRYLPPPLAAEPAIAHAWTVLWDLLRGATSLREPSHRELGRRYTEMLGENVRQPGFYELVLVAHDVDAHRDLIFALVHERQRREGMGRQTRADADERRAEVFDLGGVAREHFADAIAAALTLPVVTEYHATTFTTDSYWRGETHRLCDRVGSLPRLVDELAAMGVAQIVLVAAAPEPGGPHTLSASPIAGRARVGEFLRSEEAAAIHDALATASRCGVQVFTIRPEHNPVGPLDFDGSFDERSSRRHVVDELIALGYEDAYRQFIEPVVGASGETVG